jgi:hypothetical protein
MHTQGKTAYLLFPAWSTLGIWKENVQCQHTNIFKNEAIKKVTALCFPVFIRFQSVLAHTPPTLTRGPHLSHRDEGAEVCVPHALSPLCWTACTYPKGGAAGLYWTTLTSLTRWLHRRPLERQHWSQRGPGIPLSHRNPALQHHRWQYQVSHDHSLLVVPSNKNSLVSPSHTGTAMWGQ